MSEQSPVAGAAHDFGGARLELPFDAETLLADWGSLRATMARSVPEGFTRDEWAYVVTFCDPVSLRAVYAQTFSQLPGDSPSRLRPRGPVALWLPNNVSLLGPLVMILTTLSGNPLHVKLGSRSENLAGRLLDYLLGNLRAGPLRDYLARDVHLYTFERGDPRHAELSALAKVRIVFGSDAAAAAIGALPHPADSQGFDFVDRQSQAWVEPARLGDDALRSLLHVFAIYGNAGCTSPRRVVLIDGTERELHELRARMVALWPGTIRRDVPAHTASQNVMAAQWGRALGCDAALAPRNGAVLAIGSAAEVDRATNMWLWLEASSLQTALGGLPANIQTVGHVATPSTAEAWSAAATGAGVLRFVPVAEMHHFGPVWDGQPFFRRMFEDVERGT